MAFLKRWRASPTLAEAFEVQIPTGGAYHSAIQDPGTVSGGSVSGLWDQQDGLWYTNTAKYGRAVTPLDGHPYFGFSVNGNSNVGNFPNTGDPQWPLWKNSLGRRNEFHGGSSSPVQSGPVLGNPNIEDERWYGYTFYIPDPGWHGVGSAGWHSSFGAYIIAQMHPPGPHSPMHAYHIGPNYRSSAAIANPNLLNMEFIEYEYNSDPNQDAFRTRYSNNITNYFNTWTTWVTHIKWSSGSNGFLELYEADQDGNYSTVYSRYNSRTWWESGSTAGYPKFGGYGQPGFHYWMFAQVADENSTIDDMLAHLGGASTPPTYSIAGYISGTATLQSTLPQLNGGISGTATLAASTLQYVAPEDPTDPPPDPPTPPTLPDPDDPVVYTITISSETPITMIVGPES